MVTWASVAGFFDGEGHASMALGRGRTVRAELSQSEYVPLSLVRDFLRQQGIRTTICSNNRASSLGKKPAWRLCVQGARNVEPFLRNVLPYLITQKRIVAQDLLRFLRLYPARHP